MKFKEYLILIEGGAATEQWGTKRATKEDIEDALSFASEQLNISKEILTSQLLGSGHVTLAGKKKDSGDVDLAIKADDDQIKQYMAVMNKATGKEVYWNAASKIASYAVPTKSGKVQLDLIFLKTDTDITWAKFAYHSDEGDKSEYNGTVRNLLLVSVAQVKQEPGKDFVLLDKDDNLVARASRSYKLTDGVVRLFKVTLERKDGKGRVKGASNVTAAQLEKEMKTIKPGTEFSHESDPINDPTKAVEWLFGAGVKPEDVMTAEQILKLVKSDRFTDEQRKHIFAQCHDHFENVDAKIPPEFK